MLWHKKTSNTPGKRQTPQVPLVWNQPHISPPKRNPCLAKKIDERNQIKEQAGRVRKTHGTFIQTKGKGKNQTKQRPLEKVPTQSARGWPGPPKEKPGGARSHENRTGCVVKPQKEEEDSACNDPTIGSYNHYHLSPNGIPSGIQGWYGLVYNIHRAGNPRIRPRE